MKLYKILTFSEYSLLTSPHFIGTVLDQKDGFIHLSTRNQLAAVIDLFYKQEEEIFILEFDGLKDIKFCDFYPHLYGILDLGLLTNTFVLKEADHSNVDTLIPQ
jgi:uncharacterized protein (DUF952 family)